METKKTTTTLQRRQSTQPKRITNTKLRAMYLINSWEEEAETSAMIERYNERESQRFQTQLKTYGYVSAHHIGATVCM